MDNIELEDLAVTSEVSDSPRISYSRLSCYEQCPYCYYQKYVLTSADREAMGIIEDNNFYAENGSLVHEIHEKYFNGELTLDDLATYYADHFSDICYTVKDSIMDSTYEKCADYFCNADFEWAAGWKVIGVEMKVDKPIRGHKFIGFIDLLLENKETGDLWLIDHKSGGYPFKKTGGYLKSMEKKFGSYEKQMYLYAYEIFLLFGKYPKFISWNCFKDQKLATFEFEKSACNKALDWFEETIDKANSDTAYEANKDYFYCNNLCGFRETCEYKNMEDE